MGAYNKQQGVNQPDKDAGWGLIFRLNGLWEKVDRRAEAGDYNGWEIVLDRIWANLLYRNSFEEIVNDKEETIDVKLSDEDINIRNILKKKIRVAKKNIILAVIKKKKNLLSAAKHKHYESLLEYDVWVRKFMQENNLYLKETSHNPSKSMWGG